MTTVRRNGWRWGAAAAVLAVGLCACTTTTLRPATSDTPVSIGGTTAGLPVATPSEPTTEPTSSASQTAEPATVPTPADAAPTGWATTEPTTGSAGTPSAVPPVTVVAPTVPTYAPTADADAVRGACPYLDEDEVQADTGQRVGSIRIRPAEPQPVCEFIRNDGAFLATVRVLQLDSEATAVSAVDFYVPRERSNPESRPTGWSGGSLAGDGGSTYGVSKGTTAVIAQTNQEQSVYARLLVVHAIGNLGL